MQQGKILQQGAPEDICRHPKTRFIAELVGNKNFLPARVLTNGAIKVEAMGILNQKFLPTPPGQGMNIFLSFPGWAVELSSTPDPNRYWWHGLTRIMDIRLTDRDVEVDLELPNMSHIQTTFSRREINQLTPPLETGKLIETGILHDQLHWLPLPGE